MLFLDNLSVIDKQRFAIIEQNGNRYTYGQLQADIEQFSKGIRSTRKQVVLVLAKNNYRSIVGYLSAIQNNDAVMLVHAELEEQLLQNIVDSYQPAYIIGEVQHVQYQNLEDGLYKRNVEPSYDIHPELTLLLSTSGTTGSVKFVRLSSENLIANAKSIAEYLLIDEKERGLANLPLHYSYGLSIINSHLYAGAAILLTEESVLSKGLWDFVRDERATSFAGVPYSYQMLQRIGFLKMNLPHLRYFTQAGGRLNEKLVQIFGEYAEEHDKDFYVMYGQTEATARISYVPSKDLLSKTGSIGKSIPGGTLSIDPTNQELIYEGPNVMLGYASSYKDLANGDELQGKLHTGDLAEVDLDGYFYIKGRMKRFIKLFGLRLNLDDIERQIESALHVSAICVGSDDKMVVVIRNDQYKEQIQTFVEKLYKLHRSAFRVLVLEEIPRLSNGKVNYEAVKELVL